MHFFLHPCNRAHFSLSLIGCATCSSRFRGQRGRRTDQAFHTRYTHLLGYCETFLYCTYSSIQSSLPRSCPQVHTSNLITLKCQPNNIPISAFSSLIREETLGFAYCSFSPFFLFFFLAAHTEVTVENIS